MYRLFVVDDQPLVDNELDIEVNFKKQLKGHSFLLFVFEKNHYVEENKELLIDWLTRYNQFPLTTLVSAYNDMYEEIDRQLIDWKIEFSRVVMASEKKPVYTIRLANQQQMRKVVSALYWLPTQNEIMVFTNERAVIKLIERKISEKSSYTYLGAVANLKKDCTVIRISHDGQDFGVVSTEQALCSAKVFKTVCQVVI